MNRVTPVRVWQSRGGLVGSSQRTHRLEKPKNVVATAVTETRLARLPARTCDSYAEYLSDYNTQTSTGLVVDRRQVLDGYQYHQSSASVLVFSRILA